MKKQPWERIKLKYLASLRSGEAITGSDIKDTGKYPVYGGNGFRGYTDAYTHEGERILIGRQGALCGNINYATGRFWATEHAIVATPKVEFNATWLGETLRAMNLNRHSQSAAQPGIAVEVIENLEIQVPPLLEQCRIAELLQRQSAPINALLAQKRKLIGVLDEKRRTLISKAVTRGLDYNVTLKESGLPWVGNIPAHWQIKRLKFLAEVRGGITLGKDYGQQELLEFPYLRVANVQDGFLDLS